MCLVSAFIYVGSDVVMGEPYILQSCWRKKKMEKKERIRIFNFPLNFCFWLLWMECNFVKLELTLLYCFLVLVISKTAMLMWDITIKWSECDSRALVELWSPKINGIERISTIVSFVDSNLAYKKMMKFWTITKEDLHGTN